MSYGDNKHEGLCLRKFKTKNFDTKTPGITYYNISRIVLKRNIYTLITLKVMHL